MSAAKNRSATTSDASESLERLARRLGFDTDESSGVRAAHDWLTRLAARLAYGMARRNGFGQDAEDALQEVMLELVASAGRYEPDSRPAEVFFRTVARRKLLTWLKRQRRERHVTGMEAVLDSLSERPDDDSLLVLAEAVARLPAKLQALARLLLSGVSRNELADRLDIGNRTLDRRVADLRKVLSRLLDR